MAKWFNLIIGGVFGTVGRYALSGLVYRIFGANFPYGTLAVNLSGCFLIGFLAAISEEKFVLDTNARLLLMAGFCGAFTTFSTFMLETANLIKTGENLAAFWNVAASISVGFLLFRLGVYLAEII
ncbi:MAG: hypothetical protein A3G33_08750 [Omnitrophica bacterium RIFCSPLOWO2_12_FULL_44_17]|uniref:Fluoride-specific ion channel FluC n=1 Tax=Candidatus Danuiimicrobium aquiferis TaxID=1801832 RepID=A0A1G1L0W8_9BACT|nr:MAG: hypothetical protein A3E74_00705 [Omnitrophica bacterium RIFCSPHIGHO2_12_FULL_44_12]OGW98778.1 MAG: hypothetical protein A3G33_08750 [Omnitrophica bacterium RIFCSPLOWO2_12_FULL_44_17]OGX03749.1 MAG: hypothetical protein A3J12_10280 [Omnitrophica bacterium RIFCSPLOWO2_02_FULL_44_11]